MAAYFVWALCYLFYTQQVMFSFNLMNKGYDFDVLLPLLQRWLLKRWRNSHTGSVKPCLPGHSNPSALLPPTSLSFLRLLGIHFLMPKIWFLHFCLRTSCSYFVVKLCQGHYIGGERKISDKFLGSYSSLDMWTNLFIETYPLISVKEQEQTPQAAMRAAPIKHHFSNWR